MAGPKARGRLWPLGWLTIWLFLGSAGLLPHTLRAAALAPPRQAAPVSVDELQRLVGTLQDAAARERLVAELRALIAAQRANPPAASSTGAAPAHPEELKKTAIAAFGRLSQQIDAAAGEILAGAAVVVDAPRLVRWAREQIGDAAARQRWIMAGYALGLVFGLALAAEWIIRRVLAKLRPKVVRRHSDTLPVRVAFAVLDLVFGLLPILVFAGVAYTVVSLALDAPTATRITLSVLVDTTVEVRLLLCVARVLLLPADAGTLFVPVPAETRNYLYVWLARFVVCGMYGYAVPEAAWWLGIPGALYALLLNLAGALLALLTVVFILQNRGPIARWIAGTSASGSGWGRVRRTVADIWPLLAIVYIIAIYLIYALQDRGWLCLCAARHDLEPRRHRRRAADGARDPAVEPAGICPVSGAESAISDVASTAPTAICRS